MSYHYLSKKEIAKIEETVKIMFQKKSEGLEYKIEYDYIKDKTEYLFFLIPYRSFYLPRDLCSDFYLYMLPKVDMIINSFRISSNVPYLAYLHMVLRTRSRSYIVRETNKEIKEKQLITSYIKLENSLDVFEPEAKYLEKEDNEIESYSIDGLNNTLSDLIESIVSSEPLYSDSDIDIEINDKLITFLLEKQNRKKFLVYIMNNAITLTDKEIQVFSSIMNVSPNAFAALSLKLFDLNEVKIKRSNSNYDYTINNYWKRYLILIDTLSEESLDKKKRKELETQRDLVLKKLRAKQESKPPVIHGTPITTIAHEINRSTTCVSSWYRQVKELLSEIQIEEDFLFN